MRLHTYSLRLAVLAVVLLTTVSLVFVATGYLPRQTQAQERLEPEAATYQIIGWNDLGMHCLDDRYEVFSILPPYNTLWAQVIRRSTSSSEPELITAGITVEYSFVDNSYSAGKVNFWDYEDQLFGVNLAPNVGLTGMGLSGQMNAHADHFVAEGVPLTPYTDSQPSTRQPYQLAHLVARDTATGAVLAETTVVAPVSDEMHCDNCHSDGQIENIATGDFRRNILVLHDMEEATNLDARRPVLCADCHADAALGLPGDPEAPNFSRAIHKRHAEETQDCYQCHPGVETACLRDVMSAEGMWCTSCHGDMLAVADENRHPWLDEPRCETCHGVQYGENLSTLYRHSTGHGGLYCEACHNSTHAIVPSQQPRDNWQTMALQGYADTLRECGTCHAGVPAMGSPHGSGFPPRPVADLVITHAPGQTYVDLSWPAVTQNIAGQAIDNVTHTIHRAENDPYFSRGTHDAFATTSGLTFRDLNASGNPATNYFYAVRVVDADGRRSGISKLVGEFDFTLLPGKQ